MRRLKAKTVKYNLQGLQFCSTFRPLVPRKRDPHLFVHETPDGEEFQRGSCECHPHLRLLLLILRSLRIPHLRIFDSGRHYDVIFSQRATNSRGHPLPHTQDSHHISHPSLLWEGRAQVHPIRGSQDYGQEVRTTRHTTRGHSRRPASASPTTTRPCKLRSDL